MPAIVGGSQGRGFCLLSLDPDILYMGKCVKDSGFWPSYPPEWLARMKPGLGLGR